MKNKYFRTSYSRIETSVRCLRVLTTKIGNAGVFFTGLDTSKLNTLLSILNYLNIYLFIPDSSNTINKTRIILALYELGRLLNRNSFKDIVEQRQVFGNCFTLFTRIEKLISKLPIR